MDFNSQREKKDLRKNESIGSRDGGGVGPRGQEEKGALTNKFMWRTTNLGGFK